MVEKGLFLSRLILLFEISNFRLVPATGVLVEHVGGSLDMQASEGAVEGAPAEVFNAPVLDVGELPEQLLFALSSACIHQQSSLSLIHI